MEAWQVLSLARWSLGTYLGQERQGQPVAALGCSGESEQARRVTQHLRYWAGVWLPSGCLIWGSLREREEPVSVGVAFDPKIHASMSHKRSVA
jgi:hypothetical protein